MNRALSAPALVLLLAAATLSSGCFVVHDRYVHGSGNVESETRELEPFSAVEVRGAADLLVRIGDAPSVTIEADDNLIPLIETEVRGDRLIVSQEGNVFSKNGVKVTVTTPSIRAVSSMGASDVEVADVRGEALELILRGAGDLRAAGEVDRLSVQVTGAGDIDAAALVARSAVATIAGSGDITVHVTEELEASIAGSGDIRYAGGATKVSRAVAGSGEIRPL